MILFNHFQTSTHGINCSYTHTLFGSISPSFRISVQNQNQETCLKTDPRGNCLIWYKWWNWSRRLWKFLLDLFTPMFFKSPILCSVCHAKTHLLQIIFLLRYLRPLTNMVYYTYMCVSLLRPNSIQVYKHHKLFFFITHFISVDLTKTCHTLRMYTYSH